MTRVAAVLGAVTLVLAGCSGDDEQPSASTDIEITLGEDLPVGASFTDPSGNVTVTVNGIRLTGDLLLADAEACAAEDAIQGPAILPTAWQLRLRGREEVLPRIPLEHPNQAARPVWPDTVNVEPGRCFSGKVAFRLPQNARPSAILFTQLNPPVAWRVRT